MPTTTPIQALPVPISTDDPNITEDMNTLAKAIEKRLMGVYNSIADRNAKITSPEEGQVAYLRDTNSFTFYTGSAWEVMFPAQVSITSGTSVPSNATGVNGDVFLLV